jgi:fibronectin-binding autotransporter adhesin
MGTPLTGSTVASTYTGLLKTADNATLTSSLKALSDGSGNDSALQVSTVASNINGDFSVATSKFTVASASGNTAVAGTLAVTGATSLSSLITSGNATIGGTLGITGGLTIPGTLSVTGASTLTGAVGMGSTLNVTGLSTLASLGVTGAATIGTTLGVTGLSTLSILAVTGASTLDSLAVTNAATIGTTLGVTGLSTLAILSVTGASTLASASITGAATVGTTLGVTGATTLSGDLAANGNTTLGNQNTDTLTLNSNSITVPNMTTVPIDSANDKVVIQDATDSTLKLITASSISAVKAIYSEKISVGQSITFASISNTYAYNANGGSQFQYAHTFKTVGNTAIISMSVPVKITAAGSKVYLIITDGPSSPTSSNVIACGVGSVGFADGETNISFSTKFVSTSSSHTFYVWVASSGVSATLNTYSPAGGTPAWFVENSLFSLIETA